MPEYELTGLILANHYKLDHYQFFNEINRLSLHLLPNRRANSRDALNNSDQ